MSAAANERPICSISVDLDAIACYYTIHGLAPGNAASTVVLERALPRFVALFARRNIAATFFFVGRDVEEKGQGGRELVSDLAKTGHEIGNHTYSHPYDLARRPGPAVQTEIRRAHEILAAAGGSAAPVGFRSPGYGLAPVVLDALVAQGYRYDSSLLPSWPYYAAKAAVMGWLSLQRSGSGAVLGPAAELFAPMQPYRPDASQPWKKGQSSIVELPIAVTRFARLPTIGTFMTTAPWWMVRQALASMRQQKFFNLELHGIDLCDAQGDGIPDELVVCQPDLRVPLRDKLRRLEKVLDKIAENFSFALLRDVAAIVQRDGGL